MNTSHKHFRAVFHFAVKDVEQAMGVAQEIERFFLKLDISDPYVNCLSLEEREGEPDPHICPRCSRHWDACECEYPIPEEGE